MRLSESLIAAGNIGMSRTVAIALKVYDGHLVRNAKFDNTGVVASCSEGHFKTILNLPRFSSVLSLFLVGP